MILCDEEQKGEDRCVSATNFIRLCMYDMPFPLKGLHFYSNNRRAQPVPSQ